MSDNICWYYCQRTGTQTSCINRSLINGVRNVLNKSALHRVRWLNHYCTITWVIKMCVHLLDCWSQSITHSTDADAHWCRGEERCHSLCLPWKAGGISDAGKQNSMWLWLITRGRTWRVGVFPPSWAALESSNLKCTCICNAEHC